MSLLAWKTGFGPIHGADTQLKTWVYSLPFMMSNMIDGANVPNIIETLSFEMVFYLLLSAMFTFRVHGRGAGYALTAVDRGRRARRYPADARAEPRVRQPPGRRRRPRPAVYRSCARGQRATDPAAQAGSALAAATGLTLLLFNTSYPYNWSGLTILALMFTGTMLYRAEQGEFSRVKAVVIAIIVFALAIVAGVWHSMMWHMDGHDQLPFDLQWIRCLVLAGATFAVGMALRHRTVPRVLAWLGLVSYSVYMLHPIVLNAYRSFHVFRRPHPFPIQVLLAAGIVAVVLCFSALTYYFIESPMQHVGHRFARLLQNRFGPDAITGSVPVPDAQAVPADDAEQAPAAGGTSPLLDRPRGEVGAIPQDARQIT